MDASRRPYKSLRSRRQILVRACFVASGYAALLVILIGVLALIGYANGWRWAWRRMAQGRAIHPLGATCLLGLGLSAWLLRPGQRSRPSFLIAIIVTMLSALILGITIAGHADYLDALSPFRPVLAAESRAGMPIAIRPVAAVTLFLLSTAIILRHFGRSSAAQLIVGTASIAPVGTLLGFVYGMSGYETLMGPLGAAASVLSAFAIAGRTAHKVPLRSVLTINLPGRLIRLQIAILVGFSLLLSVLAARWRWEEDARTFGVEVAVLMVIILLTLANAAYRWQQEQQRLTAATARMTNPLAVELEDAWLRGEMHLLYQPQVRMADEALIGVEALVRWQHPRRGLISPNDFIPVAETFGLIEPLGTWVFQTVCAQAAHWKNTGLSVSVNVSPLQLAREGSAERLIEIQCQSDVPAELIVIEVTESTLIARGGKALKALRQLRDAGMIIAIDDFGTGFSSLSSLQILPSRYLKIDRSFVMELPDNATAGMIVRAVIGMGRGLGMKVVAEGVETAEQAAFLKRIGCEKAQGYLYGKPQPPEDIDAALRRVRRVADG